MTFSDPTVAASVVSGSSATLENAEGAAAVAQEQVREFEARAEEQQFAALADEFPYLAEVVAGHVAKVGYDTRRSVRVRPRPHPRRTREKPRQVLGGAELIAP